MSLYPGYCDPYSLKKRGIERLSIVYGIVPVQADGTPFKEYGAFPYDKCPGPDTPRKVTKGIVEKTDKVHDGGLFEEVKVSWQRCAVGRAALSRGVGRWPSSAYIFTAQEVIESVRTINTGHEDFNTIPDLPNLKSATDELDELIKRPLGNAALHHILSIKMKERYMHAWKLFNERQGYIKNIN